MNKKTVLLNNLTKSQLKLNEAINLPSNNEINRDASIQRFEFTFELAWKLRNN